MALATGDRPTAKAVELHKLFSENPVKVKPQFLGG
jgi:hypothetical protein